MSLENQIFKLSCELYRNMKLSKSTFQSIVECLNDFIKTTYNPTLLENLKIKLQGAVSEECMDVIEKTLTDFEDSFKPFNTEQKRLTVFKNRGLYVEPVSSELGTKEVIKLKITKYS